jgi:hypothetical protein
MELLRYLVQTLAASLVAPKVLVEAYLAEQIWGP